MTWLTKDLTLDLLAIGIHALIKASERIAQEPDTAQSDWPPVEKPAPDVTTAPALAEPEETETPEADDHDYLAEAKTLLQTLSRTGHREWIKDTLLPQFNVTKLTDVPADQLPALIEAAKAHQNEVA
ncbi:hypothetical protein [Corynebacterium sanguinis]|uniref:Uncharacterized protein n=1 Tax=Corynebacterium sanguinis TaxID=2594913 RepID=A0A6C1U078_9CORY|nr:hypothetical protein [Corynebacterium sanguinis]TVS29818.1 hypothetical protein EKI59_02545 [Corynebacterium sanguinis]